MREYSYQPKGVCSRKVSFGIEDGKLYGLKFEGGCPGNLQAISKLLEGYDAQKAVDVLMGNDCAGRGTSCADQLAKAVQDALSKEDQE